MLILDIGVRRDVVVRHSVVRAVLIVEFKHKEPSILSKHVDKGYLALTLFRDL